jgi:predicted nucleic acid-binding protein
MKTALDSNIILALFTLEPTHSTVAAMLGELRSEGPLVICGGVFSECHAIPNMTAEVLREFLDDTGVAVETSNSIENYSAVGQVFAAYANRRRKSGGGEPKRLLADFIVGAHAARSCDQLMTLDRSRYETSFPDLRLVGFP